MDDRAQEHDRLAIAAAADEQPRLALHRPGVRVVRT
jgi:hypothetical protein